MLVFYIRMNEHPIETYPVYFHPAHRQALESIHTLLKDPSTSDLQLRLAFHSTILTLMRVTSIDHGTHADRSLFLPFQIINSLGEGNLFLSASNTTHNLAALRWPLRIVFGVELVNLIAQRTNTEEVMDDWT